MATNVISKIRQLLAKEQGTIITERIDDIAMLIGLMIKMNMPEILDRHIPICGKHRPLSWGWTAVIWLAYILSEGDHRKISVAQYIAGMRDTLNRLTGQTIDILDFDDDRLSHLLAHLSKKKFWTKIENDLSINTIEVYDLPTEVVRCDPTTISGFHEVKEDGLMQYGHSKDDPSLPQVKLAMASLDPLGMPLVSEVVSGEIADDGLYSGLVDKVNSSLKKAGLLFVGDCKLSSLQNRAQIASGGHFYLAPLPLTGNTAKEMSEWINTGLAKEKANELVTILRKNDRGKVVVAAHAYGFERNQMEKVESKVINWKERVIVAWSPDYCRQQNQGLKKRLAAAKEKLEELTPKVGRGKRQIKDEGILKSAIDQIVKMHRVEGLLKVEYERQCQVNTKYVGKGRGSKNREQRKEEKIRYQIKAVKQDEEAVKYAIQRFGWKAFVSNTTDIRLSIHDVVLCYRDEYRIERIFNRLKARLEIAPLYVKRDDQIEGLTYLLTLGVRVLTLIEFVVRRSLQRDNAKLSGLHPENRRKQTDKPSAERLLKAFSDISLTIIKDVAGKVLVRWITPLSAVQKDILSRLGLDDTYELLENSE